MDQNITGTQQGQVLQASEPRASEPLRSVRSFRAESIPALRVQSPGCGPFEFTAHSGLSLDVEIGCGVGLHPIQYSKLNPSRFLVAIEHSKSRFERFYRRWQQHPQLQSRVYPVHANAVSWVTHQLGPTCVDRYFLLYPNPYPKTSDLNKRWCATPFMERILWTMKPGATLTLATNEGFYFKEAQYYLTKVWGMVEITGSLKGPVEGRQCLKASGPESQYYPRTHFEKKYMERGLTLWNGVFQKGI